MIENEPPLNFSRQEYASRLTKTRTAMAAAGIELLIVTDTSNMAWLTGYDGWSFYTHQCVLVPLNGDPIWFGRGIDAPGARRTTFLSNDHIISYADNYVQSTERHPMDYLAAQLIERNLGALHIGVEMDNYYFSAACYASLVRHLPNAKFRDSTGLVNWQRAVKSPQEIEYMRRAARIVEAMHARIFNVIEPGMKKNQLAAEIYHTGIIGADGHGGDYPAIAPMLPSGMDATAAHLTWDDRELQSGEGTFFEIAGCHRRYHCPQSRTVYLGKVPQRRSLRALKQVWSRPGRGTWRKTSRGGFLRPCKSTASRRITAPAIPSACPIRRTGASGRSACALVIKRCWSPTCASTSCRPCGLMTGVSKSPNPSSLPKPESNV